MLDFKEFLGVVTAIVSLLSAWIGYKVKTREAAVRVERRLQVVGIDDPTIHAKHSNVGYLKWLLVSSNLVFIFALGTLVVLLGVDRFFSHPFALVAGIAPVFSCALLFFMFRYIRTEPPSRTIKTARVVLAEKAPDALQHALAAVQSIGVRVARLDPKERIIEGRIPMSLWKNPSLIRVVVREKGDEQSEIEISSDATLPSVVFDFGINARNVRRIMGYLLGSQSKQ